jgi:hypothetical protein
MTEATNFLNYSYNDNHINETDKTEILSLYTNLQTYNYQDVFSHDVIFNGKRIMMANKRTILDKYGGHYTVRGTAICKNKNRIFKIWITNKQHPQTNDVCYQMLIEYYFHNIFFNSITDNILIVPETYKYGKVVLDGNDEILYFYEMEYYDSKKYVLDSINNLDDESKLHKINYFFDILKNGYTALCNMESRISVFHRDHAYPSGTGLDQLLTHPCNMLIYNDKTVLIDFGEATRNQNNTSHAVYRYIRTIQNSSPNV